MSVDAQVNPSGSTPDQTSAAVAEMQTLLSSNQQLSAQEPTAQTIPQAPAVDPAITARASALNLDEKTVQSWGANAPQMIEAIERQAGSLLLQTLGGDFANLVQPQPQPQNQPVPMQNPGAVVQQPVQVPQVAPQPMQNPGIALPQEIADFLSFKPDPDKHSPEVVEYHGHTSKAIQKMVEHHQAQMRALDEQAFQAVSSVMQAVKVNEFDSDLQELLAANPELEKVFGKGPTRRIARNGDQFKARNQLAYAVDNAPMQADRFTLMRIMAQAMAMQSAPKQVQRQAPERPRNSDGTFAPTVQIIPANSRPNQESRKTPAEIQQERMSAAVAEVQQLRRK